MNSEITRTNEPPAPEQDPRVPDVVGEQPPVRSPERRLCAPPIDIFESGEGLVLRADLPGVSAEGLELQVQDNKLTLFGRVEPYVPEGVQAAHEEYGVGDFLRSFILSDEVDHERISAKLNNGVLRVVLPKAARAEPRKISIDDGE